MVRTAKKSRKAEPDWGAINAHFTAGQRRAFEAFHYRLFDLIDVVENEVGRSTMRLEIKQAAYDLKEAINSIPWMFR
jgi:hypothetical protein